MFRIKYSLTWLHLNKLSVDNIKVENCMLRAPRGVIHTSDRCDAGVLACYDADKIKKAFFPFYLVKF